MDVKRCKFTGRDGMSIIKEHERTIILGLAGQGKSVLLDKLMKYFGKKTLIVLIDPKDEYDHIPDFQIDDFNKEHGLFRINELEYEGILFKGASGLKYIAEWLAENLFARGNCILAVEEMGLVLEKWGKFYDKAPHMATLIQQGRSRNVGFIGVSQRPQELHTTLVSQSNNIFCFWVSQRADMEYVKSYFPEELITELNRHEFLRYKVGDKTIYKHYKLYLSEGEKDYYANIFGKPT